MLARATAIKQSGVRLIVLLALSDAGHPACEAKYAEAIASLGRPVFVCTPDQFPLMMAGRANSGAPNETRYRRAGGDLETAEQRKNSADAEESLLRRSIRIWQDRDANPH